MKKLILIIGLLSLSCQPTPEFYINGKPYYTEERCIEEETTSRYGYGYQYNSMNGKYEYCLGTIVETKCLESVIDTIEIKN